MSLKLTELNFAVIAAGKGERFLAEGILTHKPLIKINGLPLIQNLINLAETYRVNSLNIITNEEYDDAADYIINNSSNIEINLIRKTTKSSFHSLYELRNLLKNRPFCLFTIDSIFNQVEFDKFINYAYSQKGIDGSLAVTKFVEDEKPLYVQLNGKNKILKFTDVTKTTKNVSNKYEKNNFVTGGIYYFNSKVLDMIEKAHKKNISKLRNFLKFLIDTNFELYGFPFSKIIDVDRPEDIKSAEEFLSKKGEIFS